MMQYQRQRRTARPALQEAPKAEGPSLAALQAGAVPTTEQLGHPVDLPGAIQSKMEASFGADLSQVRLYESQTVADAGAEAVTMGNRISFAPGKLDFSSSGGQALLGHELSHVVSQARGEVSGSGFLNDHALEARADQEGAMAAAGESVYSGPMTPISASSTAQAAGPMQAKKSEKKAEKAAAKRSRDLDHFAESSLINARLGGEWDAQTTYEDKLMERFNQGDRMELLGDMWKKKLSAARALSQVGTAQGIGAVASSEEAERFESLAQLENSFGIVSGMRGATLAESSRGRDDLQATKNSTLSPEEMAEIDAADELLAAGFNSINPEVREKKKDQERADAWDLAKRHKKKWGVAW